MVRATAAEMLKLTVTYLPGHDATSYGNTATQTDALIDAHTYPDTIAASGTKEEFVANLAAVELLHWGLWISAGGILSGTPEPPLFSTRVKELIDNLVTQTGGGIGIIDLIDTSRG